MKATLLVSLLCLLAVLSGCYTAPSNPVVPIDFVYVVGQGSNSIQGLQARSDGSLSPINISAFPTSPRPVSLVEHPSRLFVYVANFSSNTVSGYSLDHLTGVLAPIGTAVSPSPTGTSPVAVAIDSTGKFLFVLNQGSANISVFSIDPTRGLLTEVAGSPFATPSANPQFLVASPNAGLVYVSEGTAGNIAGFSVAGNGALTPFGAPFAMAAGANATGMAIDPKGQFLFAADSANNSIAAFSIPAGGVLTPVAGSPFAAGTTPVAVAVDGTGSLLFSANQGSNDVTPFKISSGALSAASAAVATGASGNTTPAQPTFVAVDATNRFLFVANQGQRNIASFSFDTTGTLTAVTNSPFAQNVGPTWIITTK